MRPLRLALLSLVMLPALSASCGSRTGLWNRDPCDEEGAEEPCEGFCGDGVRRCEEGYWGTCEVPEVIRECTNRCGDGEQICRDEAWEPCNVPVVEQGCEGTCGTGVQECRDGAWSTCKVEPTKFPCTNVCGDGVQDCVDGVFGRCEVEPVLVQCESACGSGFERCENGAWTPCDAPQPDPPKLTGVVRDFLIAHPDFEMMGPGGAETGIVEDVLGADGKPVYRGGDGGFFHTTSGADNFNQWYNDVPGVNLVTEIPLQLVPSTHAGFFTYSDTDFFPIDGELWGNEGDNHNFHFTMETHATFRYAGGEVFSFTGDDDMWVFINRRLAIDLGGLHRPLSAVISLDSLRSTHDLTVGEVYPLDFFFAERHTYESNFTIETSIANVGSCP